jgi:hypothetical protein
LFLQAFLQLEAPTLGKKELERKLPYSIFQERTMEYLSRENLFAWLDGLKTEYEVFVPAKKGAHRFYQRYLEPSQALIQDIIIGEVRTTNPLKGFFTPVREKVAEGFNPEVPPRQYITAEVQRKIEAHQVQS